MKESELRKYLAPVFGTLTQITTVAQLSRVHPRRAEIGRVGAMLSVDDLLFPLHHAAMFAGLGAVQIFMNDDNRNVVAFAKKAIRKVSAPNFRFPEPRLLTGPCPRIIGYNGKRMAKANSNVLQVRASKDEVAKYVWRAIRYSNSPHRDPANLSDAYVPFGWLRAYVEPETAEQILERYRSGRIDDRDLSDVLAEAFGNMLETCRVRLSELKYGKIDIFQRVAQDTREVVRDVVDRIERWESSRL